MVLDVVEEGYVLTRNKTENRCSLVVAVVNLVIKIEQH